jgi:hypothetical protein
MDESSSFIGLFGVDRAVSSLNFSEAFGVVLLKVSISISGDFEMAGLGLNITAGLGTTFGLSVVRSLFVSAIKDKKFN